MIHLNENLKRAINNISSLTENYTTENRFIFEMATILKESGIYQYKVKSTAPDAINQGYREPVRDAILDYTNLALNANPKTTPRSIYNINMVFKNAKDHSSIDSILEAYVDQDGKFPISIGLDDSGNLLIKKGLSMDYAGLFAESNRSIKIYKKSDNVDGVKYELAKMWYLLYLLENKIIYNKSRIRNRFITPEKRKDAVQIRSFILSNYSEYMKWVRDRDPNFDFNNYFRSTEFYKETYKVDKRVLQAFLPV